MSDETAKQKKSASPYSTAGGGFTLENRLGALLLARLITGEPVSALDERAPERVAFQQSPAALADDIVVTAPAADGVTTLRLDIAVRRAPQFVKSHTKTGELVTTLVRADLAAERSSDENVEHWLAVAVSGPQTHAGQLSELAAVALNQSDADSFGQLIRIPGKFALSSRLDHLTSMVADTLEAINDATAGTKEHRTWRLLQRLRIWQVDLEGSHQDDWTRLVADLRPVAKDGSLEQAEALRDLLTRLSADAAQTAGNLDGPTLRRRLHGHLSPVAHTAPSGWKRLTALDEQARATVTRTLAAGGADELLLPRTRARDALHTAIATGNDLLVVGDSGVGKSALAMDATTPDRLGEQVQTIAINLRHLPRTPAELLTLSDGPVEDLLGQMTAPRRILVIDAAEAAAEDHADVLTTLVRAARNDDTSVIAITTTEAAAAVKELLKSGGSEPVEHLVDGLDDGEVALIAEHFPTLQRLASDERGRELLRRPIVVDLLRAAGDPGLPLTDSQALDHIWRHLVRNQERRQDGMPDARADAMLRLAEHAIVQGDVSELLAKLDHEAVDGLRRAGLLQATSPLPWERIPAFRHDLLRSYSIARLLLESAEPAAALSRFGAPRWTLPSARLACEILLTAPDGPALPFKGRFEHLQAGFDALAAAGHGQRWSDVPAEAVLAAPDPRPILEDAWPQLSTGDAAGIERLIRLLGVRHRRHGLIDPFVTAPVIAQLLQSETPRNVAEETARLVTDWLQALVLTGTPEGDALRIKLRDSIVEQCRDNLRLLAEGDAARSAELAARTPEQIAVDEDRKNGLQAFESLMSSQRQRRKEVLHRPYEWISDHQIEHLSLLGPDLGADGEAILRRIAEDDPASLDHAVETPLAGNSLSSHSAELLADLTLAYYIDEREEEYAGFGWHGGLGDDGIRDHRSYHGRLNHLTMGPFLALLRRDYLRGVSVLNKMLDHAARCRVQSSRGYGSTGEEPESPGTVLSICDEEREFVGDGHVWLWYRGTGVGPHPCMSALQALEFVTEEFIRSGVPPQTLTRIMLADANNLAMPALALGLLIRHLEAAGDALDPFLIEPAVWQLEFTRATHEHSGLAAVIPEVSNPERRTWTLREVCMMLALGAKGDRIDAVKQLGEKLKAKARAEVGDDASSATAQYLAAVHQWASCLDREQYQMTARDDGILIELTVDPAVEEILGESNAELRRVNEAIGLTNRHAHVRDNGGRAPDLAADVLAADLALARSLLDTLPEPRTLSIDGPIAVAASAVELHLSGRSQVSDEDLLWSVEVLLQVASEVAAGAVDEFDDSFSSQGADRSAARAFPYLLLPAAAPLWTALSVSSTEGFEDLLALTRAVAVNGSNEARLAYARSLDAVWTTPCDVTHLLGTCHHTIAFRLVTESFLQCRLSDWDGEAQRRNIIELSPPDADGLASVDGDRLIVSRLTPALRATAAAAASSACCAEMALATLSSLLDAHRRGMLAHDGYHHSESDALVAARAALWQTTTGRDEVLLAHIAGLLASAKVLAEALQAVCVAAEEREDAGRQVQRLWPKIMDLVLDAAETSGVFSERTWGAYADAAVIPAPASAWGYLTSELSGDPHNWRDLLSWKPQVDRWLKSTRASRNALVHLVAAVRELNPSDQVDQGLCWIELAVERAVDRCASTDVLPEWLRERRADLRGEEQTARWQRVVDRLVVAGDTRVSDLAD